MTNPLKSFDAHFGWAMRYIGPAIVLGVVTIMGNFFVTAKEHQKDLAPYSILPSKVQDNDRRLITLEEFRLDQKALNARRDEQMKDISNLLLEINKQIASQTAIAQSLDQRTKRIEDKLDRQGDHP